MDNLYESARRFAKRKIISERELRQMIEKGQVPGIVTARGFKINCALFLEQLEEKSRQAATGGVAI